MTSADSAGRGGDTPPHGVPAAEGPPPPPGPPKPPVPPPPAADPYPDVAPPSSASAIREVSLRVSKRLLWVGDAYYPLQNIARVNTLTIHPRRKEAIVLFVKRLLLIAALSTLLGLLAAAIDLSSSFSGDGGGSPGLTTLVTLVALGALIWSFVEMMQVLSSPPRFVLAVETSGPSTAVVSGTDPKQLRQLAHQIADSIENPAAEFAVRVDTVTISPSHYYFGDNVNMYGGTGNVGMAS